MRQDYKERPKKVTTAPAKTATTSTVFTIFGSVLIIVAIALVAMEIHLHKAHLLAKEKDQVKSITLNVDGAKTTKARSMASHPGLS